MAHTTQHDIQEWFEDGVEQGATHLIVVCDEFDYEDYPVYVMPGEKVHDKVSEYDAKSMQRVMEVYNLRMDMKRQLNEHRSFNY